MWNRTYFFFGGTGNAVDNITPGIESTYCCIVDFSNEPRKICITSLILADCEQVKPVYSWTRACQESVSSCCLQSLQKNHPAQGQATEAKVGRGERETRYMYRTCVKQSWPRHHPFSPSHLKSKLRPQIHHLILKLRVLS